MKKILVIVFCMTFLVAAGNKLEEGMSVPKVFAKIYNEAKSGYSVIKADDLFNGKNKAVVVSFFASYCKPCKKEIYVLNEFYQKNRDKGVMIIEISIDTEQEGIELFKKIVDESNLTMPCVVDPMGVMSRRFGVEKLPTLFVFDKYGYVKKRFEGYTEENVNSFEKIVQELIEDKPKAEESGQVPSQGKKTEQERETPAERKKQGK
ncbi:MAG: TlpA family protein disulfide reductase [Deltaproteobacteria bacterium]|nr:TlpA family protein disulfide reductase [Deltaproteobacteria bacterium]